MKSEIKNSMSVPTFRKITKLLIIFSFGWIFTLNNSCTFSYSFQDVDIPDSIKTVQVRTLENRAQYINPQLAPQLSDKLRQKIVGQTKLTQRNSDDAHYDISGYISGYAVTTSGISNQQVATNRLTVTVHVIRLDRLNNDTKEFDISRSFDFDASLSLAQAESRLNDEMIRNLADEIFNRIFSDW